MTGHRVHVVPRRPFGWRNIYGPDGNVSSMVWDGPPEGPPRPQHPAPCNVHPKITMGCEACYLFVKGWPHGSAW